MRAVARASLVLLSWAIAAEQAWCGVSIESRAEPTTIRIGDVVRYTIAVTHDEATIVQLPSPGENLGAFEIRDFDLFKPRKVDGQVREEAEYLISTFDVGEFVIPPVRVLYRARGDSSWHELRSQPITIRVESLNPDIHGDIRDIKAPLSMPYEWRRLLYRLALVLVLLAVAGAAVYLYMRYRRGAGLLPVRVEPPRPAHEVALEELDALFHSDLFERGEMKLLHIRLSEILRKYIQGRFEVPALDMTTTEILEAFSDGQLPGSSRTTLQEFLQACDLVKFAKYQPTRDEVERTFRLAYEFVEGTRPVELRDRAGTEGQDSGPEASESESAKPGEAQ
jgi:hypothetical protein